VFGIAIFVPLSAFNPSPSQRRDRERALSISSDPRAYLPQYLMSVPDEHQFFIGLHHANHYSAR